MTTTGTLSATPQNYVGIAANGVRISPVRERLGKDPNTLSLHAHSATKGRRTKPLSRQWRLLLWLHADLNFWFCDLANLFDDWGFLNPQTGGCHEGREDNGAAPADD
jgi:hypothetical protein